MGEGGGHRGQEVVFLYPDFGVLFPRVNIVVSNSAPASLLSPAVSLPPCLPCCARPGPQTTNPRRALHWRYVANGRSLQVQLQVRVWVSFV